MSKSRIEAFSDGVIAIIITIMILEIPTPELAEPSALIALIPNFLSYIISFMLVGTYWNNHHHLFQVLSAANGRVLWANLLFLFTLSIVPFATDWLSKTQFAPFPMNCYLILMICVTLSYVLLQHLVVKSSGCKELKTIIDDSKKEAITIALQAIALIISFMFNS